MEIIGLSDPAKEQLNKMMKMGDERARIRLAIEGFG